MSHSVSMTPERWQRLQSLFDQALSLDPHARAEFAVNACGDDVSLREQLLALLLASNQDDDRFEQRVDQAISTTMLRDAELKPGHAIGRYRIVRLIGRGGMGAVYLAERADKEFEQQVAIKIVADGALSSRIVARLRSERQILANLNHPNIARLLDGGATNEGTPYLVMEYVDGLRIDRYCEERKLAIKDRLALFRQVCAAVQYAHQNLVVHRDIKPSNILVTGAGAPKLLDFGIAKLVDPNATTQGMALTRVHERVLTPEHASPEQVRGERIGTASDVYALGVLLYELLTGLKPFNFNGLSFEQMEKIICHQAPPKPSAAVLAASQLDLPAADGALAKELRGDLDTMVLKAMHKEPERRYESASALADDIGNYLANRPIAARPDSVGYRAGKFLRRNRWMVSGAAAVVVAIAGLTAFYTWRVIEERNTANRERTTAQAVSVFMQDLFRIADPSESRGNAVTVREVLDKAVSRIDTELAGEPRVRADLLAAMTSAYRGLGLWRESLELAKKTVQLERSSFSGDSVQLANALRAQADVHFVLNQFDEAKPLLDEAWAIRERLGMTRDADAAGLLAEIAGNERGQGNLAGALDYLNRAQAIADGLEERDAQLLARLLQSRASTQLLMGRYQDAEREAREALRLLEGHTYSEGINYRDNALDTLTQALRRMNRLEEAEQVGRQMLAEQMQRFGGEGPLIARTWNNLSHVLRAKGDYDEAETALRNAIALFEKQLGRESMDVAISYHNLGGLLHEAGRLRESRIALDASLQLKRKLSGDDGAPLISTLLEIASVDAAGQRFAAARAAVARAEGIARARLAANDPRHASLLATRGRIATMAREFERAESQLRAALERQNAADATNVASTKHWLADALIGFERGCEARPLLEDVLAIRSRSLPKDHWMIVSAQNSMGAALIACGDAGKGAELVESSFRALSETRPAGDYFLRLAEERRRKLTATPATRS